MPISVSGTCPDLAGIVLRAAGVGLLAREEEELPPLPEELRSAVMELAGQRKPALARPSQLARFLLGLASPAAMRARLWSHPLYGALADRKWEDVWIEAHALSGS